MGSSSSKPARKLVKEATSTTLRENRVGSKISSSRPIQATKEAFSATPQSKETYGDKQQQPFQERNNDPLITTGLRGAEASESKSKAVIEDGQDPQLMANLQKLGQVQVPRGKVHFQSKNPMLSILSARERDNTQFENNEDLLANTNNSTCLIKNRLTISQIVSMLDSRKECKSEFELKQISKGFDIDLEILKSLTNFVNSPSVDSSSEQQIKQHNQSIRIEDGDDALQLIEAVWTEPAIEEVKRIQA